MTKVDLVAQHVNIRQLPHVLLALVRRERRVAPVGSQLGVAGVALLADLCQLDLDSIRFLLPAFGVAQIGDEVVEAACLGGHYIELRWLLLV